MNWRNVEGEKHGIESQCGRFRIAQSFRGSVEYFTLFEKVPGDWTRLSKHRSSQAAKDSAEAISNNKPINTPGDYEQ